MTITPLIQTPIVMPKGMNQTIALLIFSANARAAAICSAVSCCFCFAIAAGEFRIRDASLNWIDRK